ncbi:hypothetical protein XELAEV_18022585mg [Xenopus laevis]|uniref:Uncharacterized protein n=1 Tax=Xenopus laevis TaxID=8355 RepID=A0A974D549_XENLA|nr:hypothetical protein XELAEV_18022585mg [Xenopus laevis]
MKFSVKPKTRKFMGPLRSFLSSIFTCLVFPTLGSLHLLLFYKGSPRELTWLPLNILPLVRFGERLPSALLHLEKHITLFKNIQCF